MKSAIVRRGIATAAVLGAATVGVVVAAGSASAMPAEGCNADQVTTTLVAGSPGAGQRYAEVVFTAKAHQYCQLKGSIPVSLNGAPAITVSLDNASEAKVVHLRPGTSAHELLHWTGIEARADQATPESITVRTPGDRGQSVTLPWNQGPLDASADAHTLRVGVVEAGTGPAA
ncbi:DUF4232 domain-containing protein [Amycolatopsis sp. H20-H5]|uniref:DUF4232 domain-containing protein n=1 Tax=Amycolatopsis sp. H20-H5 TaxID=3046309 RepID=UPI002DB76A63|nr:DUF4232 domain-containing protein [Amycolatopsis sp. H20-H5]MEC3979578.1 DUF4232 domain-containing protein [Amycolatopsis sp. H20-H5]